MRRWTRALAVSVALACGRGTVETGPFPAGSPWASPERPRLEQDADTNDPQAYADLGEAYIARWPDTAAAAFYWTTQLDPWRADAYYARSVALMRTVWEPRRSRGAWMPTRRLHPREIAVIDSLNALAYDLDPFVERTFDHLVGAPVGRFICHRIMDRPAAGLCYLQSRAYQLAVQVLDTALRFDAKKIELHYLRALAYYRLHKPDSAAIALGVLADSLGRRQEKTLTAFYISRATIYYAQGMAYTQTGDTAAARDAYERALVEDLGFHMASVRLAGRTLAAGDTASALNHLTHAIGLSPNDAALRLYYGVILAASNRRTEAREQFEKAIEINPNYAQPYLHLGRELEGVDRARAFASYDAFLVRSPRNDPSRAWVEARAMRVLADTLAPAKTP